MKLRHFAKLRPHCPCCQQPLTIGPVVRETPGDILEGRLLCVNSQCQSEYPIIDGIPVIVTNLRAYVAQNILPILTRRDLSPTLQTLLGDCCGADSTFYAQNYHQSIYAYAHYADLDPDPTAAPVSPPSSILNILQPGLAALTAKPIGMVIDLGCAVGRVTFALAEQCPAAELVLGVDLNFSMLRLASEVLRQRVVSYPKRRVGMVFDWCEFPVAFANTDRVDFWACDALALPFAPGAFALATSFNLLDCLPDPYRHLASLATLLRPGGQALLCTPYDWSQATPIAGWIGGHSQRSCYGGASEPMLRSLLAGGDHPQALPNLALVTETETDWWLRLHDRSTMQYRIHLLALTASGPIPNGPATHTVPATPTVPAAPTVAQDADRHCQYGPCSFTIPHGFVLLEQASYRATGSHNTSGPSCHQTDHRADDQQSTGQTCVVTLIATPTPPASLPTVPVINPAARQVMLTPINLVLTMLNTKDFGTPEAYLSRMVAEQNRSLTLLEQSACQKSMINNHPAARVQYTFGTAFPYQQLVLCWQDRAILFTASMMSAPPRLIGGWNILESFAASVTISPAD